MSCDSAKLGCMLMSSFFFFNKFILFIYLFLAALGLRCCVLAFSSCGEWGLLFVVVRGLLIAVASLVVERGLQARRLQQLWLAGSRAQVQQPWCTGLVAPRHVGSSWTRARTHVPCIGRRILNHCATREALLMSSQGALRSLTRTQASTIGRRLPWRSSMGVPWARPNSLRSDLGSIQTQRSTVEDPKVSFTKRMQLQFQAGKMWKAGHSMSLKR